MASGYSIGPYKLGSTLGVGTFGKVKLAVHEGTDLKVAVKIVNKAKMLTMDMHEKIRREISILQCLHHPHVIRLYELIDSPTDIFMAMEYVPGGELFDYIVQHSRLQEPEARKFFQQILSGVEYCHHHAVCHRDLKPENILLDANLNVKVGDFGLSNFMRDGDFLKTSCGSPNYASPEVVSGKAYAGPEVDVWSCAVILYALLCGSLPFDDEHVPNLFKKIKHGHFTLPGHLSEQSRSLIVRMLTVDPVKRITLKEIRRHPWFRVALPPYLSSATCLRASLSIALDLGIVQDMNKLGYNVDPDTLIIFPKPGSFPSRSTVAYQLLADRKATLKSLNRSSVSQTPTGFSFAREVQKRVASACGVVGNDATPFHWASDMTFGVTQSGQTTLSCPIYTMQGSNASSTPGLRGPMLQSPLGQAPLQSGASLTEWSPGSPIWTAARWKLGIESSLESTIIMTAILNTLKALSYEWFLVTPFKIRCRPMRRGTSHGQDPLSTPGSRDDEIPDGHSDSEEAQDKPNCLDKLPVQQDENSVTTLDDNLQHGRWHGCDEHVIICIQLYKISAARYLIDVQLFDGPSLVSMSESLWLTSAIYSALTQIQLQDSPGSQIPTWSPSTPMLLGAGPFGAPLFR